MACQHHHRICEDMSYHHAAADSCSHCAGETADSAAFQGSGTRRCACSQSDSCSQNNCQNYYEADPLRVSFWPEFTHPRWLAAEDLYPCLKEEEQ